MLEPLKHHYRVRITTTTKNIIQRCLREWVQSEPLIKQTRRSSSSSSSSSSSILTLLPSRCHPPLPIAAATWSIHVNHTRKKTSSQTLTSCCHLEASLYSLPPCTDDERRHRQSTHCNALGRRHPCHLPFRALHPQTKPHCPGIRLGVRTAGFVSEYYELDPNTFAS